MNKITNEFTMTNNSPTLASSTVKRVSNYREHMFEPYAAVKMVKLATMNMCLLLHHDVICLFRYRF